MILTVLCNSHLYLRPLRAMDTGDITGLKCQGLPSDASGPCRIDMPGFSFSVIIACMVWSALDFVVYSLQTPKA